MNHSAKVNAIRIIGIILTAIAIPFSLLMLFALQGVGSATTWETIVYIVAAFVNMLAVIIILIGFIARYRAMLFLYTATIHFTVFIVITVLILTEILPGDAIVPFIFAIPSAFYIFGWLFQKR